MYYPDLSGVINPTPVNKVFAPWIFYGYRNMERPSRYSEFPDPAVLRETARLLREKDSLEMEERRLAELEKTRRSEGGLSGKKNGLWRRFSHEAHDSISRLIATFGEKKAEIPSREDLPVAFGSVIPSWLKNSIDAYRIQEDFIYTEMLDHPELIEYAYWDLPVPPRLPEEDLSFRGFLKRMNIPESEIKQPESLPVHASGTRINWLHTVNGALQLSQAYVSANWYQGGNSYFAFLANFLWDVQLNQIYYPKLMFQSTVSYKLAINSTPEDEYHNLSIAQDLFQYNLKAGYKAANNWYYSFTTQFKTQFFHSYPSNSLTRSASFLSPGEFNLGLGMTYNKEHPSKKWKLSLSIAPISYNLKTCIDSKIDPVQFGISAGKKSKSEFGSNAEINFYWKIWDNISYTTKMFLFSDYRSFQGDWENTLNFQFNKLFSTQVYAHLRYDSSVDSSISAWKKWMLKEILSVGLSYTFSTK